MSDRPEATALAIDRKYGDGHHSFELREAIMDAILKTREDAFEELKDPTDGMISAGLGVDLGNEDERAAVINLWHAMISQAIRQHSQKGER